LKDTHFLKTFKDIGNAEDFWMFFKGPIRNVLFSAELNNDHATYPAGSEVNIRVRVTVTVRVHVRYLVPPPKVRLEN